MRVLGLDVGQRRVGVALSDPEGVLASPVAVIARQGEDAEFATVISLVHRHEVGCIVVGMPYSMDGSMGEQAERVQDFADRLSQHVQVPVVTWDERLSTVAAEKMLVDAGAKKARRKQRIDAAAAAIILQGYLDRMQNPGIEPG